MAMSIRNTDVERLAREVSLMTGCNLTETIEQALASMQDELVEGAAERYKRMCGLVKEFSLLPDVEIRSEDELLGYGEFGV